MLITNFKKHINKYWCNDKTYYTKKKFIFNFKENIVKEKLRISKIIIQINYQEDTRNNLIKKKKALMEWEWEWEKVSPHF